jgi:hypothetical protein
VEFGCLRGDGAIDKQLQQQCESRMGGGCRK